MNQKGGDRRPLFSGYGVAYRFLPPFFFAPPLADDFFAIALNPPFRSWVLRGVSPLRSRCLLARHPALTAPALRTG